MPHYINHFTTNHDAWPEDRDDLVATWKAMLGDSDTLLSSDSPVKFIGWISNTEGYVLLEADSKTEIIEVCSRFWPLFYNDIIEIVPQAEAGPAIIAGAKTGWQKK